MFINLRKGESKLYKRSKYNIIVKKDDIVAIFNYNSGTLQSMSQQDWDMIEQNQFIPCNAIGVNLLLQGVIVNDRYGYNDDLDDLNNHPLCRYYINGDTNGTALAQAVLDHLPNCCGVEVVWEGSLFYFGEDLKQIEQECRKVNKYFGIVIVMNGLEFNLNTYQHIARHNYSYRITVDYTPYKEQMNELEYYNAIIRQLDTIHNYDKSFSITLSSAFEYMLRQSWIVNMDKNRLIQLLNQYILASKMT